LKKIFYYLLCVSVALFIGACSNKATEGNKIASDLVEKGIVINPSGSGYWKVKNWSALKDLPKEKLMELAKSSKFTNITKYNIGKLAKGYITNDVSAELAKEKISKN